MTLTQPEQWSPHRVPPFIVTPHPITSLTPSNHESVLHFYSLIILRMANKWNHTLCELWESAFPISIILWTVTQAVACPHHRSLAVAEQESTYGWPSVPPFTLHGRTCGCCHSLAVRNEAATDVVPRVCVDGILALGTDAHEGHC